MCSRIQYVVMFYEKYRVTFFSLW